jgi:nicotinamidase-related amidase
LASNLGTANTGPTVASEPVRDATKDQLLTPHNSAFIVIDYQPAQVNSIASMDRRLLVNNIVGTARPALTYRLPSVHSTVNVKTGLNKPPIPQLRKVLEEFPTYDRTSINSWEDVEFRKDDRPQTSIRQSWPLCDRRVRRHCGLRT